MNFYPAGQIQHDTHTHTHTGYVDASGPQSDLSNMTFRGAEAVGETKSTREA